MSGEPVIAAQPPASLGSIQVLRGVAASSVVLLHTARAFSIHRPPTVAYPFLFGGEFFQTFFSFGVDVFFVISGFIMIYVSKPYVDGRKPPHDFLIRRFIRIYPMYALVTVAVCLINLRYIGPGAFDLRPDRILTSFLFIPSFDQSGKQFPIVGVAWTLIYEMFFYLCFTVCLAFARKALIPALIAILVVTVVSAKVFGGQDAISVFFKSTIVFEFALGCVIGGLFDTGRLPSWNPLVYFAMAIAILALPLPMGDVQFLLRGVPAGLIVAGVLAFEARRRREVGPLGLSFGDASYVIYLIQMIVIYDLVHRLISRLPHPITNPLVTDALIVGCVLVSVGIGWLAHLVVEKPIRSRLNQWYARQSARRRGVSVAAS